MHRDMCDGRFAKWRPLLYLNLGATRDQFTSLYATVGSCLRCLGICLFFSVACSHSPSNMRRSVRCCASDLRVKFSAARVVNSPSYMRRSVRYFTAYVRLKRFWRRARPIHRLICDGRFAPSRPSYDFKFLALRAVNSPSYVRRSARSNVTYAQLNSFGAARRLFLFLYATVGSLRCGLVSISFC